LFFGVYQLVYRRWACGRFCQQIRIMNVSHETLQPTFPYRVTQKCHVDLESRWGLAIELCMGASIGNWKLGATLGRPANVINYIPEKEWRLHSSGAIATESARSANEPRPALSNSGSFALTPTYDQHKSVFGKYPEIPKTIHSCFGYLCAWVDNDRDVQFLNAGRLQKALLIRDRSLEEGCI